MEIPGGEKPGSKLKDLGRWRGIVGHSREFEGLLPRGLGGGGKGAGCRIRVRIKKLSFIRQLRGVTASEPSVEVVRHRHVKSEKKFVSFGRSGGEETASVLRIAAKPWDGSRTYLAGFRARPGGCA